METNLAISRTGTYGGVFYDILGTSHVSLGSSVAPEEKGCTYECPQAPW